MGVIYKRIRTGGEVGGGLLPGERREEHGLPVTPKGVDQLTERR